MRTSIHSILCCGFILSCANTVTPVLGRGPAATELSTVPWLHLMLQLLRVVLTLGDLVQQGKLQLDQDIPIQQSDCKSGLDGLVCILYRWIVALWLGLAGEFARNT